MQLFYVIEGAVTVKVHRTSFVMAVGGQFMVPRGMSFSPPPPFTLSSHSASSLYWSQPHSNSLPLSYPSSGNQYSLHTISQRPAKLFFAQARRMAADEDDVEPEVSTGKKSKK
jgi:centromere protein C